MGSEQSTAGQGVAATPARRPPSEARLYRGNTIAVPDSALRNSSQIVAEEAVAAHTDSRPCSPPISVCSDSDLPYISYTDRPIGDSPKIRSKGPQARLTRANTSATTKKASLPRGKIRPGSTAHNIVVVKAATKEGGIEKDPDILRLQSIPMFLPVMRGTLSLPANRDPEVMERLQPVHLNNMCRRVQAHYSVMANRVAADQAQLTAKVKEIDGEIGRMHGVMCERQKTFSTYAEHFAKLHSVSQQLSRCNAILNETIASAEVLNNFLEIEDRLEPFVWTTH
ncbi:BLOC-1-related complex subunit 5 [Phlebotomus argentipes]|uniref:BLOC-1-related complex subunit 5 n=1 Tax=Phlebotomus argentipes TaxID=94469 RepID=UPI002892ACFB|nr:BLOC-1-related complex subunit 5 [Phlebotomus argentipes]